MKSIQTLTYLVSLFVVIINNVSATLRVNEDHAYKDYQHDSQANEEENRPFVQVCCEPGMYYRYGKCSSSNDNVAYDLEFPEIYTPDLQLSNMTSADFARVYGVPCRDGGYGLEPGEPFYFQEDGTILTVNLTNPALITQAHYCLAAMQIDNVTRMTITVVCYPPESQKPIEFIIFWFLSGMSLTLTFVVYSVIVDLQNIHGMVVRSQVFVLSIAYYALVAINLGKEISFQFDFICLTLAYIVHFSFLASFFWLNVMCFDIWWTFGGFRSLHGSVKQRERKKFIMYSIYAWGCASIITITCIIMDQVPGIPETFIRPEFGKGSCWFFSDKARFLYFYLPMAITIICNICLFVLTALKLVKHKKDTARQLKGSDSRRHDDNKQWFNLYLKLFIVMGINWSTEIISWLFEEKLKWLWYITDLTNTLQGVIIFVIFVWKDKIKRLLLKRFGCDGGNFLSRNSNSRTGCANANSVSTRTCVTTAPLHEKSNPYSWKDSKGKSNMTFDESDGV